MKMRGRLGFNLHAPGGIQDMATNPGEPRDSIDERAEANSLHDTVNFNVLAWLEV
jgi:hypothetical protein